MGERQGPAGSVLTLYGSDYSVYVRIARMALHEKGLGYRLAPIDVFSPHGVPADYLQLHPFGRIPALEADGFTLFETSAICRYVDEAFDGPALQPSDAKQRARVNQIISIADTYLYPQLVWGLYVELVAKVQRGEAVDQERVTKARGMVPVCLGTLDRLMRESQEQPELRFTLADAYLAAMLDYFVLVPEAPEMLARYVTLDRWWQAVRERESFVATRPTTT